MIQIPAEMLTSSSRQIRPCRIEEAVIQRSREQGWIGLAKQRSIGGWLRIGNGTWAGGEVQNR